MGNLRNRLIAWVLGRRLRAMVTGQNPVRRDDLPMAATAPFNWDPDPSGEVFRFGREQYEQAQADLRAALCG